METYRQNIHNGVTNFVIYRFTIGKTDYRTWISCLIIIDVNNQNMKINKCQIIYFYIRNQGEELNVKETL